MSLDTDVQLLSRVPMLSDFSPDQLRLLAFSAENRSWRSGQRLFTAGDRSDAGYVVITGAVDLTDPARPAAGRRVGPGGFVDEFALITEGQRAVTATAVGDVTAIVIRRPLFRRMLDEYPEIARRLQARIAANLADTAAALATVKARLDSLGD
jgi:CRP-like cAMP-binding protein